MTKQQIDELSPQNILEQMRLMLAQSIEDRKRAEEDRKKLEEITKQMEIEQKQREAIDKKINQELDMR